jgi:hypothetical protein
MKNRKQMLVCASAYAKNLAYGGSGPGYIIMDALTLAKLRSDTLLEYGVDMNWCNHNLGFCTTNRMSQSDRTTINIDFFIVWP